MEIQVYKLRELMDLLKPAVPKKSTLPVTTYIRVGEGKAVATDLDVMVIADLPEATEPILLPFASLAEMLKYVPGNEVLKIEAQNKAVSLTWSGGTASYPTLAVQDFPVLPEMVAAAEGFINGDALIPAMLAALPYAATDDTRPVLSGVTLVLGNPLEVAAGDGFRLSLQVLGLAFPRECKIIVPAHGVEVLGHVFAKTPRTPPTDAASLIPIITAKRLIHMALIGDSKLRVDFGRSASVIITLIQGTPPDYLALVPKGEPILRSQISAPHLEAAVKRVRDIAKEGSGIVRMEFADSKVTVSAHGEEQVLSATMDTLNTQGEPGRTALNYKYLLDYVSGKDGIFTLSQYEKTGPLVFQYPDSPKVLIMPMHVQWDGEKPPDAEKTEPVAETTEPEAETAEPEAETIVADPETTEEKPEVEPEAAEVPSARKKRSRKPAKEEPVTE